jgi:hypothetical protein
MGVREGAGEEEREKDKGGRDKKKVKECEGVRGKYEENIELYIYYYGGDRQREQDRVREGRE